MTGTQDASVVGAASIDIMEEHMEKQVTFQSDTTKTVSPSIGETISARRPRYRSINQATNHTNQCR